MMRRVRTAPLHVTALCIAACTTSPSESLLTDQFGGRGAAVGTIRDEPQTFNRQLARDNVSALMTQLTQAGVVRINRTEDVVEPWLAESWRSDDDGRTHKLTLRDGVTFSDGEPFSSADVLFSFEAVYDARVGSAMADSLLVDGQPIAVEAPDATTVVVRFPVPFSPGLRLLAGLPILPRHLLEAALRNGTFQDVWGLSTPPAEMAGLGPFVLESYQLGQRLVFARKTRYWRTDEVGVQLPYLDRITLEIVADQNAEMLRLEAGEVDFISSGIRAEDFGSLQRAADAGQVQLFNLGVGLDADFLAFNLQPAAMADDPRRPWLQSLDWRLAVSHAVDRTAFANTIYLGLAEPIFGPITPGNLTWFLPDVPVYDYDLQRAQQRLEGLGLADRDGDGLREGPRRPPRAVHPAHTAGEHEPGAGGAGAAGRPATGRHRGRRGAARVRGAHRAGRVDGLRCRLFRIPRERHRPGGEPGLLAELGGIPPLESQPADAGHRLGAPDRRALRTAADGHRHGREAAAVLRGPDRLRRTPADPLLRCAAAVGRHLGAHGQCRALAARALRALERRLTGRSDGTDPLALTWQAVATAKLHSTGAASLLAPFLSGWTVVTPCERDWFCATLVCPLLALSVSYEG